MHVTYFGDVNLIDIYFIYYYYYFALLLIYWLYEYIKWEFITLWSTQVWQPKIVIVFILRKKKCCFVILNILFDSICLDLIITD